MTTTHTVLDTLVTLGGLAALLTPVAVLLERTHRRSLAEHGHRTSRLPAADDADLRRVDAERLAAGSR